MILYLQMIDDPGDRSKFEQLYHKYRNLMHYTAYQVLRNQQDAEDAVQNAFVSIANNMKKIFSVDSPKTRAYVVTIVEHKAIDLYRQKQRHPAGELSEELAGVTVEYDQDDGLARCMAKLPARDREYLLLRFAHGHSVKETAKVMGLSLAAAYKLEQRAKKRLEELCREVGVL